MPQLNQAQSRDFLDRFYSFNDAVLRKIEVFYSEGERTVSVWIATRDAKETKNSGWVCVQLTISRAQDFCFSEMSRTSAQVLSQGLHICWFDSVVGIDFGHFVDPPDSLEELKSSQFFATGMTVDWEVEAY